MCLLIIRISIVELDSPVVAILYITGTGLLWALLIRSSNECLDLRSTAYGHGQRLSHRDEDVDHACVLEFSPWGMQRRLFLMVPSTKSFCLMVAIGHSSQLIVVSPGVLFNGSWSF